MNMLCDSLVLWTANYEEMITFYRALGFSFEIEKHEDGPEHSACQLGSFHFAVYKSKPGISPARGKGGHTQVGFQVDSIVSLFEKAIDLKMKIVVTLEEVPWGKRFVLEDPDGRSIEFNQASKG